MTDAPIDKTTTPNASAVQGEGAGQEREGGLEPASTFTTVTVEEPTFARRITVVLILVLTVFLVGAAGYILVAGVLAPSAPRTAAERQLRSLEIAVEETPSDEQAHADYARALIASEQYATAARVIEYGIAVVGRAPALLVAEARLAYINDDGRALLALDEAYAALDQARETLLEERAERGIVDSGADAYSATYTEAALLEAAIHVKARSWELAIEAYAKALAEDKTMADVLVLRGEAFVVIGATEDARADFEEALKYTPDYEPALEGLTGLGVGSE